MKEDSGKASPCLESALFTPYRTTALGYLTSNSTFSNQNSFFFHLSLSRLLIEDILQVPRPAATYLFTMHFLCI